MKCHRCNHANDTVRNKKRCSSCRSWKDGIAPLSASARCVVLDNKAGVELRDDVSAGIDIFEDARENDSPNTKNVSCRMVGTTSGHERTGERRESPLQSIDGRSPLSPILAPPSLARRPTHQYVTRNVRPLQCSGVYEGSFWPAFTFAARSLQYTVDQLRRWAREPDFGLKSFAGSILSASLSLCLPYQGVILDRAHNPCDGFIFRAVSCTGSCSTTEKIKHCEHCASNINVARKVRRSNDPIVEPAGKQASIQKISRNPDLAELEIRQIRDENRNLRRQLARVILMDAMEKDGAVFHDGAEGDRIRRVVDIIDEPISDALRSNSATEGLEIWQIHSEHISKVSSDGKRKCGRQKYHQMLMNWAMAFLSRTSCRTYNEVAKIMIVMLPCIGTVYRKTAEIISTKNDKAYCLHMNTIRSISDRADREGWTCHQRIGVIAQDSANINAGIEHDYVTNTLKGGDESHSVAILSRMLQLLAQRVKGG